MLVIYDNDVTFLIHIKSANLALKEYLGQIYKSSVDPNTVLVSSKKSRNRIKLLIKNQRKDQQTLTLNTNGTRKIGGGVTMYDWETAE